MDELINEFIKNAETFYEKIDKNSENFVPNHRFKSWEHNYRIFCEEREKTNPDIDKLSIHLSFYLASWGIFTLQVGECIEDHHFYCKRIIKYMKKL